MSQPDLCRRVERTEADLTAIADTVVDIQETVNEHTSTLAMHTRELGEIRQEQERQSTTLAQHGDQLRSILDMLTAIQKKL